MTNTTALINNKSTSFVTLSEAIQETFSAIDRFEWQACDELRRMRDEKIFTEGGYPSFEKYCEAELSQWGGYRRVGQLIGAKQVIDSLKGTEYDGVVKRESHARQLLKLVKTPEKLKEAVAIAIEHNPQPVAEDFKKAVLTIVPPKEQLFLKNPQNPDSAVETVLENCSTWGDPKTAFSAPTRINRTYTQTEHEEAIARLEEQHRREKERLESDLRIGIQQEAEQQAIASIKEQLAAAQAIALQKAEEVRSLHQRIQEMEGLRRLEVENQQLRDRIGELERSLEDRLSQQWGNTMSKQAEKVLNTQAQKVIEQLPPELHLKVLATSTPKENVDECLQLMGMALSNLAIALDNAQLAQAAALLEQTIEPLSEHEQLVKEAVAEIRKVLATDCNWNQFKAVADEFEQIKNDCWKALSNSDRAAINRLKQSQIELEAFEEKYQIHVGDWVTGSDIYSTNSTYKGVVENIKPSSNYIYVVWKFGDFTKERDFFEPKDLKVIPEPQQEVA